MLSRLWTRFYMILRVSFLSSIIIYSKEKNIGTYRFDEKSPVSNSSYTDAGLKNMY